MPLVCPSIPKESLTKLNQEILKLPLGHPLHKETMDGDVTVFEDNGYAVYHSAGGFYFNKILTTLENAIRNDIRSPREYLCTAFEMRSCDKGMQRKLIERFQETYGLKYSNMIEHHCFQWSDKYLMLAKMPSCVVRSMLSKSGGTMRTVVRGPTESLRQIPTLVRLGNIQEGQEMASSLFVTQYGQNSFHDVCTIHYDLMREVLAKPNMGVTINPFMVWDP